MPAPVKKQEDSVTRFLIAADEIFVEMGYRGTTIRKICERAEVSLAILHRHWPSKEALFQQVFSRHFEPIHKEQHNLFDELLKSLPDGAKPTPAQILEAFYKPAFLKGNSQDKLGHAVYCRAMIDPAPEAKKIVAKLIFEARARLIELMHLSVPHLNEREFFLAINLVFGGYIFPLAFGHQLAVAMNYQDENLDWAQTAKDVANLVSNGIGNTKI